MAKEQAAYEAAMRMHARFHTAKPRPEAFGLTPADVVEAEPTNDPEVLKILEKMNASIQGHA